MNIFDKYPAICGNYKSEELKKSSVDLWEKVNSLRNSLGEDAYILDVYLSEIFTAIAYSNTTNVRHIVDSLLGKLEKICQNVINGNASENPQDSFSEYVHNYITSHPLPYKEHQTKCNLYSLIFINDYMAFSMPEIIDEMVQKLREHSHVDVIRRNFKTLSEKLGEVRIEILNDIITKGFLQTTLMDSLMQVVSQNMCFTMIQRDPQTSKQLFQLLYDVNILHQEA